MSDSRKRTEYVVTGALIAAAYVALTFLSNIFSLAYGPVQFRISEALTVLPFFTPAVVPGVFAGVFWLIFWAARSGKSAPGRPEPVRGRDFWGRHRIIPDPAAEERDENRYAGPGKWTV